MNLIKYQHVPQSSLPPPKRVVITGMGSITPLGYGVEANWQALCAGKSGIGLITRFDATGFRSKIAGEIHNFRAADFVDNKLARKKCRFIHLAMAATRMALEDSGLTINSDNAEKTGVSVGTAVGGMEIFEESQKLLLSGARHKISPFFLAGLISNMPSGIIAVNVGAKGPNTCPVTACTSSTHAIGDSYKLIQRGAADIMIAGGTEASILPTIFAGLDALKASSARNDSPEKASRPFDMHRDGFVTSEGSAILILEEMELALARGAKIYAEIVGYGLSGDAYHITSPDPEGKGGAHCVRMALNDANTDITEIDYINAHGTSTRVGDPSETNTIKAVFGEQAYKIPVSANKSMLGHLWGAAGAMQSVVAVMSICRGIIPPTINYETPDPLCDLNYVANIAKHTEVNTALIQAFGFGGANAALVFNSFSP